VQNAYSDDENADKLSAAGSLPFVAVGVFLLLNSNASLLGVL
jgi:hypothetical protein